MTALVAGAATERGPVCPQAHPTPDLQEEV